MYNLFRNAWSWVTDPSYLVVDVERAIAEENPARPLWEWVHETFIDLYHADGIGKILRTAERTICKRSIVRMIGFCAIPLGCIVCNNPGTAVLAQSEQMNWPEIINDEGGPVLITGVVTYTNPLFTVGTAAPMVILEDQAGFIDRNENFLLPIASQTLGQITSDFFTSPFSYSLSLPLVPQGTLRDVDNNGQTDQGVMVFAVAYWTNIFGGPFLEERDLFGGGWSTAYASTQVSMEFEKRREIIGGSFIVYALDEQQGFPSGFGADGLLFTEDDPIVRLHQGYTIVHIDSEPFIFDRSRQPQINLIEPANSALDDFSNLSYSAAFDAMVEKLRKEYAFTEYKNIDWDALSLEFRPRFVDAKINQDRRTYLRALRDFSYAIPDGHVSGPFLVDEFRIATAGGLGMALRELDDDRVIANFILENGPADKAGIELRAEIIEFNERPIHEALDAVVPWSGPFSTAHVKHLQQLRYLVRSSIGTEVRIIFKNPGDTIPNNVTLKSIREGESFSFSSLHNGLTGFELPLEYELLDSGYAYVKIYDFSDNELLTVQLWERMIRTLNQQKIADLIIDMRHNSGGSGFLADQMAAYFYDKSIELGNAGFYNDDLEEFYFDPRGIDRYYLPAEDLRFHGDLAILIGPNCNSACEFFAYDLTIDNRATIVGHYPTAGLGGSIDVFLMPEGELFQFTRGRSVDMNGEIHIEGKGVQPHIWVPVNEETLFSEDDPILEAAIAHLSGKQSRLQPSHVQASNGQRATPTQGTDTNTTTPTNASTQTANNIEGEVSEQVNPSNVSDQNSSDKTEEILGTATVITDGARLRVRSEPTTKSRIQGYARSGGTYDILEFSEDGTWIRIAVPNLLRGDSGWVSISYVRYQLGN